MADVNDQINDLINAIQADPKPINNWYHLGGIMLAHQAWDALFNLFNDRETMCQDGWVHFANLLLSDEVALSEHIIGIFQGVEYTTPQFDYEIFLQYVFAAAKISKGEIKKGRQVFRKLASIIQNDPALGVNLPHISGLSTFQLQLFTNEEVAQFLYSTTAPLGCDLKFYGEQKDNDCELFYTACDLVYFEKFADKFVDVFEGFGPIHIHVINGNKEKIISFINRHGNAEVSVSTESQISEIGSPYYAAVRFLRANEVMGYYNKNLVILDIDVEGEEGLGEIITKSTSYDVSLFRGVTLVPWLRHAAAAVFIKNNSVGVEYLNSFSIMLNEALKNPAWFLDQSILHCVNQYWENSDSKIALNYFDQKEGYKINEIIIPVDNLMEKRQMRTNTGFVR